MRVEHRVEPPEDRGPGEVPVRKGASVSRLPHATGATTRSRGRRSAKLEKEGNAPVARHHDEAREEHARGTQTVCGVQRGVSYCFGG